MSKPSKNGRVPLERAISKLGLGSRVEARAWIEAKRVKVHGSLEVNPSRMVNPDTAHIEVDGLKAKKEKSRVVVFYKPKGVVTTKRDPEGRPTIYDFIPKEMHHFHAVGRLDMHTTGLLLLTNDTKLSNFLADPENEIARTYLVTVRGEVSLETIERMKEGVLDAGERLRIRSGEIKKTSGKESLILLHLVEGKNREIRRLCEALGHEVIALKRISFGKYELGDLKPGELREE